MINRLTLLTLNSSALTNTCTCLLQALVDFHPQRYSFQAQTFDTVQQVQANVLNQISIQNENTLDIDYNLPILSFNYANKMIFYNGMDPIQQFIQQTIHGKHLQQAIDLVQPICTIDAVSRETAQQTLRIFMAGDRANVGKTTVCLGLLGALLQMGYKAEELAYIKPATQCTKPQLVTQFCQKQGIQAVPIGPIVFEKGFTRNFLQNKLPSAEEYLAKVSDLCDHLATERKVLVVDGVGYPAVGSICGLSNAQVAEAAKASVVLVCPKGVGHAVDSYNLNATYFVANQCTVLGGIFNRMPEAGYYSLANCKANIESYFQQYNSNQMPYGFLPDIGKDVLDTNSSAAEESTQILIDMFSAQVDIRRLLHDAAIAQSANAPGQRKREYTEGQPPHSNKRVKSSN